MVRKVFRVRKVFGARKASKASWVAQVLRGNEVFQVRREIAGALDRPVNVDHEAYGDSKDYMDRPGQRGRRGHRGHRGPKESEVTKAIEVVEVYEASKDYMDNRITYYLNN